MRIGSSSYSFKRLDITTAEEQERTLLDIVEMASSFGLAGLELLACHFASEEREYVNSLKRLAVSNALDIYALSLHNNFVKPEAAERRREVEFVLRWLDTAERLGAPLVRVFGGRWGTVTDFVELMRLGGREYPLPGYEYQQAIGWNVDALKECAARAGDKGITLVIENHWGLTCSAQGVLEILAGVDSPWLKVALDCGNFLEDTYPQLEALAPHTELVHAKSYHGGGMFYDFTPDYDRIMSILRSVGYNGYLSIEFEGKSSPAVGIPHQVALLEAALSRS